MNTTDDYRVLVHETGHFIVCSEFGIWAEPKVLEASDQYPESYNGQAVVAGVCKMKGEFTPFEKAVVGWAGILAEYLMGLEHPGIVLHFPLSKPALRECFSVFMANFHCLSIGDQTSIAGYGPSQWVPFKAAYRILTRRKAKLKRLVAMQKESLLRLSKPVPEPAMNSEPCSKSFSPQQRAALLENHLAQMRAANPDRPHFEAVLAYLKRGEEPPVELLSTLQPVSK